MKNDFVSKTNLAGVVRVKTKCFSDARGEVNKLYDLSVLEEGGIPNQFCEEMDIHSKCNVLRGIHMQTDPPQGKLLRVISGAVYLVIVDLKKESENIGQWEAYVLSSSHDMIYIPHGYGVASLTLEEDTVINIKYTTPFCAEKSIGVRWNDSDLNITWPLNNNREVIVSEKDKSWPLFSQYITDEKVGFTG